MYKSYNKTAQGWIDFAGLCHQSLQDFPWMLSVSNHKLGSKTQAGLYWGFALKKCCKQVLGDAGRGKVIFVQDDSVCKAPRDWL